MAEHHSYFFEGAVSKLATLLANTLNDLDDLRAALESGRNAGTSPADIVNDYETRRLLRGVSEESITN